MQGWFPEILGQTSSIVTRVPLSIRTIYPDQLTVEPLLWDTMLSLLVNNYINKPQPLFMSEDTSFQGTLALVYWVSSDKRFHCINVKWYIRACEGFQ